MTPCKSAPFVIPFFIAHQGCPHRCRFCNQHAIAGVGTEEVSAAQVQEEIAAQLAWPRHANRPVQVAFYGGSFTGLPQRRQQELLTAVAPFLAAGQVQAIRLSTRPDYIDAEVVHRLRQHGVRLVELGIQSLDDQVLASSGRGHTVADVEQALAILREGGMQVGGQLMVGLPGDSRRRAVDSARRLAALRPDLVRIYPTLVMAGSPLAESYGCGRYRPWSLALATAVCARMKEIFDSQGIAVVRLGLQSSVDLERGLVAGPYHPAFGELVMGRLYFRQVRRTLYRTRRHNKGPLVLQLAERDRSLFVGQGRQNMARFARQQLLDKVDVRFRAEQARFSMEVM